MNILESNRNIFVLNLTKSTKLANINSTKRLYNSITIWILLNILLLLQGHLPLGGVALRLGRLLADVLWELFLGLRLEDGVHGAGEAGVPGPEVVLPHRSVGRPRPTRSNWGTKEWADGLGCGAVKDGRKRVARGHQLSRQSLKRTIDSLKMNIYKELITSGRGRDKVKQRLKNRLAKSLFLLRMVYEGIGQNCQKLVAKNGQKCQNWWSRMIKIIHGGVKVVGEKIPKWLNYLSIHGFSNADLVTFDKF